MPKFINLLRQNDQHRLDVFNNGMTRLGYTRVEAHKPVGPGDVLIMWNRYGGNHERAISAIARGAKVLVVENCSLGNGFRPGTWYNIARDNVAVAGGVFQDHGPERWDSWGIELAPWSGGEETLILAQRGIGAPTIRSPDNWAESMRARLGTKTRIRPHPGAVPGLLPLENDLQHACEVITWASAGGVQSLWLGKPVFHVHPDFVMGGASRPFHERATLGALRDDDARLKAFRRLAWCMWECETEIATGDALATLLT
jgi:hypothetical protein